ncbi:c-type cytochrome [Microvirga roseola]|uniref:c-type cytochrome n=1 Tax=Microvirga roseola TaxID=2883126 RepID=UPI001E3E1E34|nr:c-type cytochrome [Microvirga roseola]
MQPPAHLRIVGGDAERGRALIQAYECGSCHMIEGIRGADGVVGPPLTDYAQRMLLAGIVPNAPRTLVPWLMNPPAIDPDTAMPNLGISEPEARDIATYLYTLGAREAQIWPVDVQPYGQVQVDRAVPAAESERIRLESASVERAMDTLVRRVGAGQAGSPAP